MSKSPPGRTPTTNKWGNKQGKNTIAKDAMRRTNEQLKARAMRPNGGTIRTIKNRDKFFESLAETCNVTLTATLTGLSRLALYQWRKEDAQFAKDWDEALELGANALEDEAVRRAKDGVLEPVFYKGEEVGYVRKYSDTLMIFMLKGAKPGKYADKQKEDPTTTRLDELLAAMRAGPVPPGQTNE